MSEEYVSSLRVDLNASIMYAGSLFMNPTVSDNRNLISRIEMALVYVDNVVNISRPTSFDSPVNALNNVVLPADV